MVLAHPNQDVDRKRNEKCIVERQRGRRAKRIWVKHGIVGIQADS
jgi:hypothetical protein